jgi:hypothetical protein
MDAILPPMALDPIVPSLSLHHSAQSPGWPRFSLLLREFQTAVDKPVHAYIHVDKRNSTDSKVDWIAWNPLVQTLESPGYLQPYDSNVVSVLVVSVLRARLA